MRECVFVSVCVCLCVWLFISPFFSHKPWHFSCALSPFFFFSFLLFVSLFLWGRLHSAGHLLDTAMNQIGRTDLQPSKGYHFPDGNAYVGMSTHSCVCVCVCVCVCACACVCVCACACVCNSIRACAFVLVHPYFPATCFLLLPLSFVLFKNTLVLSLLRNGTM